MIKAKQDGGGGDGGGRNVGDHPDGGALVVKDGRYGPYVAWGKVFATIPKSQSPDSVTLQDAIDLVNARAAATGKKGPVKKAAAKKKPAAKKAAAKPKKIEESDETPFEGGKPAKKAVAKKGAAKKVAKKAAKK
jgi:DNA topoisomerase-1